MREVLGFIADHPTPKIHHLDGVAYAVNSRDYKGVMIVVLSEKVGAETNELSKNNRSANGE